MNRFRHLVVAAAVASLAACSTVMPTVQSGFLSDYAGLASASDESSASRASADHIDPARVSVDAVTWRVTSSVDISADEREALLTQLRSELQRHVRALPAQQGFALVGADVDAARHAPGHCVDAHSGGVDVVCRSPARGCFI